MSSAHDRRLIAVAVAVGVLAACGDPAAAPARGPPSGSGSGSPAGTAVGVPTPRDLASPSDPTGGLAPRSAGTAVGVPTPRDLASPSDPPHQESFRLLDAGHGARSALRYALAAGTAAFTARTVLSQRHLDHGQFSAPVALPAIRDGFAITTTADHPGRLALRALAGEAAANTADADAYLAPWRNRLEGRLLTIALDDRGAVTAITFDDTSTAARSEPARDEVVQRLLTNIVPLPADPVGPGARWRVVTILRQGPAYAKQTASYTLTSRTAAAWKLHVKLLRVGEEQHLIDPSLPRGTTADLLALFRVFEGDVEVDAAHPLITRGSLAIESRMHVRLQDAGQPASEQMFEDTGRVEFALCRPAAHPAPAPRGAPFGACPAGFSARR